MPENDLPSDSETITREIRNRVLRITLNRPDDRNTLMGTMLDNLRDWLEQAQDDPEVGSIMLTGAGDHFCAGASFRVLEKDSGKPASFEERCEKVYDFGRIAVLLSEGKKPTLAMLRGAVAGGGIALAAACDLRLADRTLRLSFGYSRIGLSGDVGVNLALTRLLGPTRAKRFALLSPVLSGEEALAEGLVDSLYENAELEREAVAIAERLAMVPPQAAAGIKQNIAAAATLGTEQALRIEAENFAHCQLHGSHPAAIRAFMNKTTPEFDHAEPVQTATMPLRD